MRITRSEIEKMIGKPLSIAIEAKWFKLAHRAGIGIQLVGRSGKSGEVWYETPNLTRAQFEMIGRLLREAAFSDYELLARALAANA